MFVQDIIFCLNAINRENEGASANVILSAINPEYVPGLFSFSVIITVLDIDTSKEHKISVYLKAPNEELVVDLNDVTVPSMPKQDSNLPKEYLGLTVALDLNNVNFRTSGLYNLDIIIDNQRLSGKSIFVKGKNE